MASWVQARRLGEAAVPPEMGDGGWKMGSGEWRVESGEWGVGSGEWGVGSGEWGVGSGECLGPPKGGTTERVGAGRRGGF